MIGQTISHYKILEKLGEGGMGVVYKAHDTELHRDIALKFLPHYLTSDAAERERFYHEARAASAINHPNVTTIYEIRQANDQFFFVMEYVEGKTLKELIEEDALPISKILEIAIQISEGLNAAAEKGVVHRDIKSDNIMITTKGQVKITDFGLAKLKGASRLTKEGSTLGTAAYMSPEQANGEESDHRSDIFSFGVVLYELIAGRLPFQGEHHAALMYSLMTEDPPPLARFNDKVTTELERIVSKALAKDRGDRYQHVDELLADLRRERKQLEYVRSGYVKTSTVSAPVQSAPLKNRFRKYLIVAAAVVSIVALLLILNPFNFQLSMQKSTASEKNSLAVMYFENIPDPADKDHTGNMLADLLITALSQTRELEVISRERLHDIQKDLGQADSKNISSSLATQVAKRAGVKTMLLGSILQKEPTLVVTARLVDVESGKIVASQRLTSFTASQVFGLVDSLALLIRGELKMAQAAAGETKSVAEVTTVSPEAYRSYVAGIELNNQYRRAEAKAAFERAVELDRNFAMAHYNLAGTLATLGYREAAKSSFQKALKLIDRVTEREQLQIMTTSFVQQNQPLKAAETAERLIQLYPHEMRAYLQLGVVYQRQFEHEKVVDAYRRGLIVDPSIRELWNQLSYALGALNRKQEAVDAANNYLKLAPSEPNPRDTKGDIFAMFGEYDSSRAWYQQAERFQAGYSTTKLEFDALMRREYRTAEEYARTSDKSFPALELSRGRFQSARKSLANVSSILMSNGPGLQFLGPQILIHISYEIGDNAEMLRLAKSLSSELSKDPEDKIHGRDYLAWALARNGNGDQAEKVVHEVKSDLDPNLPSSQVWLDFTSALIAFEEGKFDAAVDQFRKAYMLLPPNCDPNLLFAVALLRRGETAGAIGQLERLVRWFPVVGGRVTRPGAPGSAQFWPMSSVEAHYWLGVAYEERGDKLKATKEYETFLDIWKDADAVTKEMQEARVRLAKLKGSQ